MGFTRINEFVATEGCEEQLMGLLGEVVDYLQKQKGCLGAELLVAEEDDARLVIIERWDNKDAHHQALMNAPKEKMMEARQWFARPPRGEFFVQPGSSHPSVH